MRLSTPKIRRFTHKRTEAKRKPRVSALVYEYQRFKNILADVLGVVWEASGAPDAATQRIDFVSDYAETMLGYSIENWLQTPNFWLSLVHPNDKVRAAGEAVAIFNSGMHGKSEFRWIARDGRVLWVEALHRVITGEAGHPIGMRSITLDITSHKQAEIASQHVARRWKTLHEIERAILTAQSSQAILQVTLAGVLSEIVPCLRASVVQFDVAKHEAEVICVQTRDATTLGVGTRLPLEELFGNFEDLQQGKAQVLEDLTVLSGPFLLALQREGIRSYLSVPLISHGALLGALNLGSDQINGFDAEAINTAHEVADALALALQQTRLLEAEQEARRMAETLQKATTALAATLDLDQVLNNILDYLLHMMGYASAAVLLLEEDRLGVAAARAVAIFELRVGNLLPADSPLFEQLQQSKQPRMLSRDQLHVWTQHVAQVALPYDPDQWLSVPLAVYGTLIGTLILGNGQPRVNYEQEIALVQTFAQQAAVAIHNARIYESVRRQREELRFLTARLAEAEESERRRLARELHDQIGQNLAALNFVISTLQAELSAEPESMIYRRLDDAQRLLGETGQQIYNLMSDLRPTVLDDYGLWAALRWYSDQFTQRTGILITLADDEPIERLALTLETTLFRIAQEALTNVAKHAQATAVTITLAIVAATARLTIADNGVGITANGPERPTQPAGWGLLNMRERAEALGGRLKVHSSPGQGTQVFVEIPG